MKKLITLFLVLSSLITYGQATYPLNYTNVVVKNNFFLNGPNQTSSTTYNLLALDPSGKVWKLPQDLVRTPLGLPLTTSITLNGQTKLLSTNPSFTISIPNGTVTNFGVNPLSTLFTNTVDNPTTSPVLNFTATPAPGNTFLAGPNGSNGAWAFRTIAPEDLPIVPLIKGGTGRTSSGSVNTLWGVGSSGAIVNKTLVAGIGTDISYSGDNIIITNTQVDTAHHVVPDGTVKSVGSGFGLTGGPITVNGVLALDTSSNGARTNANSLSLAQLQARLNQLLPKTFSIIYNGTTYNPNSSNIMTINGGTLTSIGRGFGLINAGVTFFTSGTIAIDSSKLVTPFAMKTYTYDKATTDANIAAAVAAGGGGGGGGSSNNITAVTLTSNVSSYNLNNSNIYKSYVLSNNLTAISFILSSMTDGDEITVQYNKTTASDVTLTFPTGTILKDENGPQTGVSDVVTGTATSLYLFGIKKIGSTFFVGISKWRS